MKNIVQILKRLLKSFKLEIDYHFWKWGTMPNVTCSRNGMKYLKNNITRYYGKKEHEEKVKSFFKLLERAP